MKVRAEKSEVIVLGEDEESMYEVIADGDSLSVFRSLSTCGLCR